MMTLIRIFLTLFSVLFLTFQAHSNDKELGIESDIEELLHEIQEEEKQNEPQDEYSLYGEKEAYSDEDWSLNGEKLK